ncbi:hypothetical protein [Nocardia acidivorans]|nr:hypothetical protein [Nocardia acidivorans]
MCALRTPVHDVVIPGGHSAPDAAPDQWTGWIGDLIADTPISSTRPH